MRPLRVYLIGYDPPELDMEKIGRAWIDDQIARSDFCFSVSADRLLRIGDTITIQQEFSLGPPGSTKFSRGDVLRIVDSEHFGKVVWVARA